MYVCARAPSICICFANFPQECNECCATAIMDTRDYFIQIHTDKLQSVFTNKFVTLNRLNSCICCSLARHKYFRGNWNQRNRYICGCGAHPIAKLNHSSYHLYVNSIMSSYFILVLKWDVDFINDVGLHDLKHRI